MPIYEYRCLNCGELNEFLVGVGKEEELKCKKCSRRDLTRLLSIANVSSSHPSARDGECCGLTNPCDNPKRCCTERCAVVEKDTNKKILTGQDLIRLSQEKTWKLNIKLKETN